MPKYITLFFAFTLSFSATAQLDCDYSIEVVTVGIRDYIGNGEFEWNPFCESNWVGSDAVDFEIEVCRTPDTCEAPLMAFFNGSNPTPITFTNWPEDCRTVVALNKPYAAAYEICLGEYDWGNFEPISDPNSLNDCTTISVPFEYCETGCVGDTCSPDLEVWSNDWLMMSMDNSSCIDEIGNEAANDGDCNMSVENNSFFIYETVGTENFCLSIVGEGINADDDQIQFVVWDLSIWPWDGDCSVTYTAPIITACDFTAGGGSGFQNMSLDTMLVEVGDPLINQYLVMIDGVSGEWVDYSIEFCGTPIFLELPPPNPDNDEETTSEDPVDDWPRLLYLTDLRGRQITEPEPWQPYLEHYHNGTVKRKCLFK